MSSMRKYVNVAAVVCALSAVSSGAWAQKATAPLPTNPGGSSPVMPAKMSCMVKIADAAGKAYPDPILTSQSLPKAFVYYQITNGSNLPADGIAIKVAAAPTSASITPNGNAVNSNLALLNTLYTVPYPQPNVTLAKMTSTRWIQAGALNWQSVKAIWNNSKPNTMASVLATVSVAFSTASIKGCSTKFAANYYAADLPQP